VSALEKSAATRGAARALGDHDLEKLDAEMERLANAREREDRARAEAALQDAADAARRAGAPDVAKALEEEKRLLQERGARADSLRDLAEAMRRAGLGAGEVQRRLDALNREASDADARALADAMRDALDKLTPEERARLAEKLASMAKGAAGASDPQRLQDLAKQLETEEGRKALEEAMRSMANEATTSGEAAGEAALDVAAGGAEATEREIAGDGAGGGSGGGSGSGAGSGTGAGGGGEASDGAGGGGSHDFGTGSHRGRTDVLAGDTLKSRAHGSLDHAAPMRPGATTFVPGRAGGTADARGTGDLRSVAPAEIEGIDKSDVPEEYREQVRQYFTP
jgi:hypothetical protein